MRKLKSIALFFILLLQVVVATEITPDKTVFVPMRDGTTLPTDLYLPKNLDAKAPCILLRSAAGRNASSAKAYLTFTQLGYIVAIQDTRSSVDITGKTLPYWTDGWSYHQDGYDAVEWLAHHESINGNVGTIGASTMGITQLLMAPSAPPSLKCQYIGMASASLYHDAIFPGGQLLKNQVEGWLKIHAKDPEILKIVCSQKEYNAFWETFNANKVASQVKAPAILYAGWYDTFLQGTIDAFIARQENGGEGAKDRQKLLIGPWTHFWPHNKKVGDFDIPVAGLKAPSDISAQQWFDFHLKEIKNGVMDIPAVTYYVMGPFDGSPSSGNVWRKASQWPIPAVATPFYLTANQKLVDASIKPSEETFLSYTYDSNQPVPTIGGRNLFLESGAKDQRSIEERSDVIVFTSEELPNDMEVTGPIVAKIYVTSSQPTSDVVVRFCDVYPDGRSILIADGLTCLQLSSALEGSDVKEVDVDLWSTSIVFAKGHRIRISISGSNYPHFQKNDFDAIANNAVHIGGTKASYIMLPLVSQPLAENSPSDDAKIPEPDISSLEKAQQ